jgi:hypothetical protein
MSDSHTVAEAYKRFVVICLERAQDAGDPAVRAWWTNAAQSWHDRAVANAADHSGDNNPAQMLNCPAADNEHRDANLWRRAG